MKLVEILAEEMEEWPKGVTHLTQSAVDREIYNAQDGKDTDSLESLEPRFDSIKSHDERGKYPVVTRAQWQAERDRQKGGEWKRHRGNSQPVDEGTWVEVKLCCGDIQQGLANAFLWRHADCDVAANIMQYRVISQPQAEDVPLIAPGDTREYKGPFPCAPAGEPVTELEWDIQFQQGIFHMEAKTDQIDGPIKWRDTVNELDAYIEEFTREREALINRLALEGFSLLPAMTAVMGVADVDFSDWRNWRAGDIVECITNEYAGTYTEGREYKIEWVKEGVFSVYDNYGEPSSCDWFDHDAEGLKFVRRP